MQKDMTVISIQNLSNLKSTSVLARVCASFLCRFRGLTFRRSLAQDEGLLMVYENESRLDTAIHMLGMWMDLTIIWIDKNKEVVDIKLARKWRLLYVSKRPARYVLEMHPSRFLEYSEGDLLGFNETHTD